LIIVLVKISISYDEQFIQHLNIIPNFTGYKNPVKYFFKRKTVKMTGAHPLRGERPLSNVSGFLIGKIGETLQVKPATIRAACPYRA
jgi:hypothetical protein